MGHEINPRSRYPIHDTDGVSDTRNRSSELLRARSIDTKPILEVEPYERDPRTRSIQTRSSEIELRFTNYKLQSTIVKPRSTYSIIKLKVGLRSYRRTHIMFDPRSLIPILDRTYRSNTLIDLRSHSNSNSIHNLRTRSTGHDSYR